jgi:hypothetical protein
VYVLLGLASEKRGVGRRASDHELAGACVDCGRRRGVRGRRGGNGGRDGGGGSIAGVGVSSVARGTVIVGWRVVVGASRAGRLLRLSRSGSTWALLAALAVLVDVALATSESVVIGGNTAHVTSSKVAELGTGGEGVDGSGTGDDETDESDGRRGCASLLLLLLLLLLFSGGIRGCCS